MIERILDCLSETGTRATYGAVGNVIDLPPQSVGSLLGTRRRRASWVVNAATGMPTGYRESEMDPRVNRSTPIVTTARIDPVVAKLAPNPSPPSSCGRPARSRRELRPGCAADGSSCANDAQRQTGTDRPIGFRRAERDRPPTTRSNRRHRSSSATILWLVRGLTGGLLLLLSVL